MADTFKGIAWREASLQQVSDEALTSIIENTELNIASLQKLYNSLINERVRRGLKLPEERFLNDDTAPLF